MLPHLAPTHIAQLPPPRPYPNRRPGGDQRSHPTGLRARGSRWQSAPTREEAEDEEAGGQHQHPCAEPARAAPRDPRGVGVLQRIPHLRAVRSRVPAPRVCVCPEPAAEQPPSHRPYQPRRGPPRTTAAAAAARKALSSSSEPIQAAEAASASRRRRPGPSQARSKGKVSLRHVQLLIVRVSRAGRALPFLQRNRSSVCPGRQIDLVPN
jgi:hypothetical protein